MSGLTLTHAARTLDRALRDHRYEETLLGPWVVKYGRWKVTEGGARPRTWDDYERTLSRMCVMLAHLGLEHVRTDDLRRVIASFPEKSRGRTTAAIRDFWKWLDDEELIDRNPASRLRSPKQARPLTYDVFSETEAARLITHGPDRDLHPAITVRDRACILLLLRTGMRAGELRHLRVDDFDLLERWVIIREGKGGHSRVVPYVKPVGNEASLGRALEELMLTPLPHAGRPPERGDHVFWGYRVDNIGTRGSDGFAAVMTREPLVASGLHSWWGRVVKRAGVRYRSMHMCRHTVATNLVRSGAHLVTVQKLLGHRDIKTTVGYTHLQIEDVAAALEHMEAGRVNHLSETPNG